MSTSSEVYTARINTPVFISLSSCSRKPYGPRSTSDEASTTFSRPESCPKIHPTFSSSVRHGSLTVTICPPPLALSTRAFSVSTCRQYATSTMSDGYNRHSWTANNDVFASAPDQHRIAPVVPPHLPDYADIEPPPPPYNPNFLVPTSRQRLSDVAGRRTLSSGRCPPPPPPSQRSSTTSDVRPRTSSLMPLVSEQCLLIDNADNDENDDGDDDDDVFISEKRVMLGHKSETCV